MNWGSLTNVTSGIKEGVQEKEEPCKITYTKAGEKGELNGGCTLTCVVSGVWLVGASFPRLLAEESGN